MLPWQTKGVITKMISYVDSQSSWWRYGKNICYIDQYMNLYCNQVLWEPAKFRDENNSAKVYVGSSLTVHNPTHANCPGLSRSLPDTMTISRLLYRSPNSQIKSIYELFCVLIWNLSHFFLNFTCVSLTKTYFAITIIKVNCDGL